MTGTGDVRLWTSLTDARPFGLVPPGTELDGTDWDQLVESLLVDA